VAADGTSYNGAAYTFAAPSDAFGLVATAAISPAANQTAPTTQIGFIVRKADWQAKDVPQDRFIPIINGQTEVWLVSGDANVYTSLQHATAATPHIINAYLENPKTIIASLSQSITLPFSNSNIVVNDQTNNAKFRIVSVDTAPTYSPVLVGDLQHLLGAQIDWNPADNATLLRKVNANLYQFTGILPAGTYHYKIALHRNWDGAFPPDNITLNVPPGGAKVTFSYIPFELKSQAQRLYDSLNNPTAPLPLSSAGLQTSLIHITLAQEVDITHHTQLVMRNYLACDIIPRNVLSTEEYTYSGSDLGNTFCQDCTKFRVWAPTALDVQLQLYDSESGPLTHNVPMQRSDKGTWYAEVHNNLENWYYLYQITIQDKTQTAIDPYVHAIAVNATRGMIVDLTKTHPEGWENDHYQQLAHPVDAIIYETHVRDFSIDDSSGMTHKGHYLAFTERDTKGPDAVVTGVDSLKQLGITHVQLLPIEDFASIDETDPQQYNWGYDPRNYTVPEGAYATTPHGTTRISECKRMIQSLHASQLGVIMDVVYNHTFDTSLSDFDKIVPQYYYRTDYYGNYTNGSGVGNELATERPMVQNFVRASISYWVQESHIDGFRFDLMALIGVETMKLIAQDVHALNPHGLIYGEPWIGAYSGLPEDQLLYKGRQKELGIGVFNDNIRNAIIGSALNATEKGFATGNTQQVDAIKRGVEGSINDFTANPGETINYVTSHDNLTLWDKIAASYATAHSEAERIRMDKLAQAIIFTSQGVPFIQGGEEFLRTKGGNDNSYKAGDSINKFAWSRKNQYPDVFAYYASLIQLRKDHAAFRMTSAHMIRNNLTFLGSPANTVAFLLNGQAVGDIWEQIIVIYNANTTAIPFSLPDGTWNIAIGHGNVSAQVLDPMKGSVVVEAIGCMVLYRDKEK
jgi:pullulanase